MNKLTQQEAQDLITKAWQGVSERNLGQYRFGSVLWMIIPEYLYKLWRNTPEANFQLEPDPDVSLAKFYKYFVQDRNNQLDSEQY